MLQTIGCKLRASTRKFATSNLTNRNRIGSAAADVTRRYRGVYIFAALPDGFTWPKEKDCYCRGRSSQIVVQQLRTFRYSPTVQYNAQRRNLQFPSVIVLFAWYKCYPAFSDPSFKRTNLYLTTWDRREVAQKKNIRSHESFTALTFIVTTRMSVVHLGDAATFARCFSVIDTEIAW